MLSVGYLNANLVLLDLPVVLDDDVCHFLQVDALALVLGGTEALASPMAQSGAPTVMSYQGYLTDSSGQPISGTVNLKFGLYANSSGGASRILRSISIWFSTCFLI